MRTGEAPMATDAHKKPRVPAKAKARAAAEILAGATDGEAARAAGVSKRMAGRVRQSLRSQLDVAAEQEREEIAEELRATVLALLRSIRRIAEQTRNVKWICKQSAHELAVLAGVQMDKAVRILEAAENAGAL